MTVLDSSVVIDYLEDVDRMPARDVLVAATARSTGSELLVADADFDANRLRPFLDVVQLAE